MADKEDGRVKVYTNGNKEIRNLSWSILGFTVFILICSTLNLVYTILPISSESSTISGVVGAFLVIIPLTIFYLVWIVKRFGYDSSIWKHLPTKSTMCIERIIDHNGGHQTVLLYLVDEMKSEVVLLNTNQFYGNKLPPTGRRFVLRLKERPFNGPLYHFDLIEDENNGDVSVQSAA